MNEFDYLDDCHDRWESLAEEKLTREQQAVVDVCSTIGCVEGDGVLCVWSQFGDSMERIIESFRMAGASEIAQLLEESSFCRDIIARTSEDADEWDTSDEEEQKLSKIDLRIPELGPDAREGLLKFLPKNEG